MAASLRDWLSGTAISPGPCNARQGTLGAHDSAPRRMLHSAFLSSPREPWPGATLAEPAGAAAGLNPPWRRRTIISRVHSPRGGLEPAPTPSLSERHDDCARISRVIPRTSGLPAARYRQSA